MLKHTVRAYTTFIQPTDLTRLTKPAFGNYVILNFFSAGYNILVKNTTVDGLEYEHKIFRATTSYEAAVAYLKDYYGNKEICKL